MGDIKPIETRYKGYRFRSRLEARWAVFLDAMNEPWEYEKEGFELPTGRYLPDFFLPRLNVWLEIKGSEPSAQEISNCEELRDATGKAVFLVRGMPNQEASKLFCWDSGDSSAGCSVWDAMLFAREDGTLIFLVNEADDRVLYSGQFKKVLDFTCGVIIQDGVAYGIMSDSGGGRAFNQAEGSAKSARFEFGESGPG